MARRIPRVVVICWIVAITALAPATALSTTGTRQVTSFDANLLSKLNEVRISHGLVPLTVSDQLSEVAQAHSRDMIAKGYFAHASSDGSPFWKRIQRVYGSAHDRYWSVGENLFWTSGRVDAAAGLSAWMASPVHRENVLNPNWRQIGIGATSSKHAPGRFKGLPATVITTDFGVHR